MAKFSLLSALAIPLVPVVMFACGGDDTPMVTVKPDATQGSGSGSGSQTVCSVAASYGDLTFGGSGAAYVYRAGSAASGVNRLIFQAKGSDDSYVEVILLGGCGSQSGSGSGSGGPCAAGTPDWPTTFGPKAGIDLSATGDVLVAQLANLNSATNSFDDLYVAGAGILNVTGAGNGSGVTYSGNASSIQTIHVDSATFDPAADGCESAIQSLTWNGTAHLAAGKPGTMVGEAQTNAIIERYLAHRHY